MRRSRRRRRRAWPAPPPARAPRAARGPASARPPAPGTRPPPPGRRGRRARPRIAPARSATASSVAGRGVRAMPRAPVGIGVGIGRVGERAVHVAAVARGGAPVDRRAHQRMPEAHVRAELDQPGGLGRRGRVAADAEPLARRATAASTSPIGLGRRRRAAAAACRAAATATRREEARSIRPASGRASGSPNPPASSAGVSPRGSSSSASGLPRVSATIRSRTRSSSRPGAADAEQRARVARRRALRPAAPAGRRARRSSAGSRTANTIATGSASSRRATNASTCAEARSSHCASSTRQTQRPLLGRLGQQAQHREARPGTGPGGSPSLQAERHPQRVPLRCRQPLEPVEQRRAQVVQAGERELHLGLHAAARATRQPAACVARRTRAAPSCRSRPRRAARAPRFAAGARAAAGPALRTRGGGLAAPAQPYRRPIGAH